MSKVKKIVEPTSDKLAETYAEHLADFISSSPKDSLHIALSGGSTPKLLFKILAEKHANLPWNKVHFYWGDERCVPPTDSDSNFKMTRELLLDHIDIPSKNVHRVLGESDPISEAARYSDEIDGFVDKSAGLPAFDLIILGMGDDGHTASIFPHEIELLEVETICDVANHPTTGQKRVTLTGRVINNAKRVDFLVTGANKLPKTTAIFNQSAEAKSLPASHIAPIAGELNWYLDKAADPS